jgi:hypothetical protein
MKKIFATDFNDYSPRSSADGRYLYEQYERITQFLAPKIGINELKYIAKPVKELDKNQVVWQANFPEEMQNLDSFDIETQSKIEADFVTWNKKILQQIRNLSSGNDEELKWADLLKEAFSVANIKLISDGTEWALIWGWEFRNKLQTIEPNWESDIEDDVKEPSGAGVGMGAGITPPPVDPPFSPPPPVDPPLPPPPPVDPPLPPAPPNPSPVEKKKRGFLALLRRFFRWLAYRFWGLMMLIVYTLLIIFLTKKCTTNKDPNCEKFQQIENELKELEGRIKERCQETDTTTVQTP